MSISGISSLAGISETANSGSTIAGNFDTFLQLLTTQLQNQNPLDPLDTNQFTQQLVQFTEVEQSLKTNEQLSTLLSFQSAATATAAVSYIGTNIRAEGTTSELENGSAVWTYNLAVPAPNSQVTIRDEAGKIVFSEKTQLQAGEQNITWDGSTTEGTTAPDGLYNITIDARDANDLNLTITTSTTGKVDSVDLSETEPVLLIGSKRIKLSSVTFIEGS
jgi:flagellar basal-body rod modification protein FlgD